MTSEKKKSVPVKHHLAAAEALHGETRHLASFLVDLERRVLDLEQQHGPPAAKEPPVESSDVSGSKVGGSKSKRSEGAKDGMLLAPLLEGKSLRIVEAAWELENAFFNQVPEQYPSDVGMARAKHVELLRVNKWYNLGLIGLVFLTFFEVPAWCHESGSSHGMFKWVQGSDWCKVYDTDGKEGDANLSGIAYLPPGLALIIEVVIEAVVLWKFFLEFKLQQTHFEPIDVVYHNPKATQLGCFFAIGNILDTATFIILRQPFRLTFLFRSGLIFLTPWVQHIFFNIFNMRVLGEFTSVGVFFLGTMFVFAWIGLTLFKGVSLTSYHEGEKAVEANEGLTNISEALYTMFVGGVTGDFIDSFLPSFYSFRAVGLLWMLYLLLSQVLFKNLVMDTLISAYLKGSEEENRITAKNLSNAMHHAFTLLSDGRASVSEEDFLEFVEQMNSSPRCPPLPQEVAKLIFAEFGSITQQNFVDVCFMMQNRFIITSKSSTVKSALKLENDSNYEALCEYVRMPEDLPEFDKLMNNVLLLNLGMVILESVFDLMNWTQPFWMDFIEIIFSLVYLGEVCIKLSVVSWQSYWMSASNRFDFATTWLLLMTSLLPFDAALAHYANVLRLLRLLRILKQLKQYPSVQFMVSTISRIISAAGEILSLMGTFFFFFCSLSVNVFGGWLFEGNELLEGSEYEEKHWFALNFNDMFMAAGAWFVQVLCEFVPVYADAIYRASPNWGSIAWWLFIFFYISTAAIMYELLLAFTVEVFMEVRKELPDEEEEGDEEEGEEEEHGGKASDGKVKESAEEEEKFDREGFMEGVQTDIEPHGKMLHYRMLGEAALQEEVKEAYEVCIARGSRPSPGGGKRGGVSEESVSKAAWMLENGIYNQPVAHFPTDVKAAREIHYEVLMATNYYNIAILGLILLTAVEVPAWCHGGTNEGGNLWTWRAGDEWCSVKGGDLNLSGISYLPPGYALIVEIAIEMVIIWKFMLELSLNTTHFAPVNVLYFNRRNIMLGLVFAVGSIVDTLVFALFRNPVRLTFIFRSGLLCLLPGVQRLAVRIFNRSMMGEFISVAVFFVGTVLFFAWIALTVFKSIDTVAFYNEEGKPIRVNEGFTSLHESVYTMFVAGVTETFVDIFMPSYSVYHVAGLLWLMFLLLTEVLFLNLVIDAFVLAYLEGSEKNQERMAHVPPPDRGVVLEPCHRCLRACQLLATDGIVSKAAFLSFLQELAKSPRMTTIDSEVADVIFTRLGVLTEEKFCDLCLVLQNKIWVAPRDSVVMGWYPKLWEKPWFERVREMVWEEGDRPSFDDIMNWVLLANLVLVFAESSDILINFRVPHWLKILDVVFTFIYVGEVGVKLAVKSFAEYWSSAMNQFDFFTTFLLLFTTLLKYLPIAAVQTNLSHYANLLRLLRLLRVVKELKQLESVQFMVTTITRMVLAAGDIFSLLGVVLFMFTTFSVNFFGGVLYRGHTKLEGTAYIEKNWTVFNFNDHVMAFATWFTQLLCEYAPEWAEALSLASSWGSVAWYIFPLFYLIGVAILFEILKAFTIETFLALKEEADEDKEDEKENEEEREEKGKEEEAQQRQHVDNLKRIFLERDCELHCQFTKGPKFLLELRQAYVDYQHAES